MKIFWRRLVVGVFAVCLIAISSAAVGLSLRNSNFLVSFADSATSPGDLERFQTDQVYNSKSSHMGIFGWDWGTLIGTSLMVQPDSTVDLTEWGSGADNRFTPPEPGAKGRIIHIDGQASPVELEFRYAGGGAQFGTSIRSIKATGAREVSSRVSEVFSRIGDLIRPVGESLER